MKSESGWLTRDRRKFKKAQHLLPPCIDETGGVWADLGCGEGIFTAVLYEQIGPSCQIHAVDINRRVLDKLKQNFQETYPDANINILHANFEEPLSLPNLDGVILANALHFVKDDQKAFVLENVSKRLKPNGKIIVIEYNTDRGNLAVPYPLPEKDFVKLALRLCLRQPLIVVKVPSTFLWEMYAGTALAS
jgi:ubiquinone/menaquinone biosynthesis C-methylase UbiE